MISKFQRGYIGLLMGDFLYREQMTTHKGQLYSAVSNDRVDQVLMKDSLEKMSGLTNGIYETSRYLLLNNKKKP